MIVWEDSGDVRCFKQIENISDQKNFFNDGKRIAANNYRQVKDRLFKTYWNNYVNIIFMI